MSISGAENIADRGGHIGFDHLHRIGPVHAVASTPAAAARRVCELAQVRRTTGTHIHLINAYTVALADRNADYARVLSEGAVNLPDGKPLSWISRLRGDDTPLAQVRGHQLFLDVFNIGRSVGLRHYLLGSTEDVLEKMVTRLSLLFPGAEIVGTHSPPFRALSSAEVLTQDERIRSSGAQVVWVGLGTPKQDHESRRLAETLPIVAIAVGAAFDFTAETVREAPQYVQRLGMEWAYRFAREPRRLWRRYVFGNGRFVVAAIRHGKHGRRESNRSELGSS